MVVSDCAGFALSLGTLGGTWTQGLPPAKSEPPDCSSLLLEREWHVEATIMVHTVVDGTFRQTNLANESSHYLAKREELRLAEIELMRRRERVAELQPQSS